MKLQENEYVTHKYIFKTSYGKEHFGDNYKSPSTCFPSSIAWLMEFKPFASCIDNAISRSPLSTYKSQNK